MKSEFFIEYLLVGFYVSLAEFNEIAAANAFIPSELVWSNTYFMSSYPIQLVYLTTNCELPVVLKNAENKAIVGVNRKVFDLVLIYVHIFFPLPFTSYPYLFFYLVQMLWNNYPIKKQENLNNTIFFPDL
ncbi:MAG: hypothetical protein HRU34_06905 [Richelia sp.]|nr:hypothetical protein [Richelia sp.]